MLPYQLQIHVFKPVICLLLAYYIVYLFNISSQIAQSRADIKSILFITHTLCIIYADLGTQGRIFIVLYVTQ